MTNEGQTGEQKLNIFPISAPYHHCAGEKRQARQRLHNMLQAAGRFQPVPPRLGRMGKSMF
jgi:hypothetical protein